MVDRDPTSGQVARADLLGQRERQARAAPLQQQELEALRARLERRDEELREAHAILVLVLSTRVYRLMRLLGRWGWLERRIRRALRQGSGDHGTRSQLPDPLASRAPRNRRLAGLGARLRTQGRV